MNHLIPSSVVSFAAAVLLANSPITHAGEPAGDAQSQAASILVAAQSSNRTGAAESVVSQTSARASDVQEQARNLLLGNVAFDTAGERTAALGARSLAVPVVLSTRIRHADADAQERARAVVLGRGV